MAISVVTRWLSLMVDVIDLDETCHVIGAQVLLAGRLLYTDFVDNKPPLLYVYYALTQIVAGKGLLAVHVVSAVLVVPLTALAVSSFYEHSRAGLIAALTFLLYSVAFIGHDMLAANAELLMILPASWAVVLVGHVPRHRAPWTNAAAGVLFGLAVLVKPQIATWIASCGGVWLYARVRQRRWGLGAAEVLALAAGSALPLAATYVWFERRGGADALLYWTVWRNLSYASNPIQSAEALRRFVSFVVPFVLVTGPLWWATSALLRRAGPSATSADRTEDAAVEHRRLLTMWLVAASVVPAFLGFRFFPHYFVQLYVPLALAAAPWLEDRLRSPLSAAARAVLGWTGLMVVGFTVANAALYLGNFRVYRERDPIFADVAARIRRDECAPGPLFVWGWAPMIYYFADMPIASRFVVLPQARLTGYVFGNVESNRGNAADEDVVEEHWDWLMEDLRRSQPTFFVDTAPANIMRWGRYPIARYPRLQQYVAREFERADEVGGVVIYRRHACRPRP